MNTFLFRDFCQQNPVNDAEWAVEYFSYFGGLNIPLESNLSLHELLVKYILNPFDSLKKSISMPLGDNPLYPKLLHAISIGDRREKTAFKRAHIGKEKGAEAFDFLRHINYLSLEFSREKPLQRSHPKQRFKKEIERHKISDKFRFSTPFLRFWFAFIAPFESTIRQKNYQPVLQNFDLHCNEFVGFIFEELCDLYLHKISNQEGINIIRSGSYWDREIEIDLYAETDQKTLWIGECKWTNHKIGKKELRLLEEKCRKSNLYFDKLFLFCKRGFSNELQGIKNSNIFLVDGNQVYQTLLFSN